MDAKLKEKILVQVSEEDIVSMSCDVINIPSPTGEELEMGRYLRRVMEEMDLTVTWQEVEEGRANVVGRLEGSGVGKNLMFNGHMDTSYTGEEKHLTGIGYKSHAVVKDGIVYGLGIYNMKGALVCYVQAVKALQRAGAKLKGDVIIAAVAGEIEKAQWSEDYTGKQYRGYGAGTHYLVNRGAVPDMCILGEPTDGKIVLGHYGSLWARISTKGPFMHTAFSGPHQKNNSIRRMHTILGKVLEWIPCWEEKGAYQGGNAIVNLGAIRGGHPWRLSRTPERTDLFLDVRVPPTIGMAEARRELQKLVTELRSAHPEFELEFETYVSVPGAEIAKDHEMIKVIEASHKVVTGSPVEYGAVVWCSDASVLIRYDIPTVNYGPSSGPRGKDGEKVPVSTLVDMTRVYALIIADICGAQ